MKIILASGSPRRKELLEQAGYRFIIEVSDADENIQAEFPCTLVEEVSHRKAGAVAAHYLRPVRLRAGQHRPLRQKMYRQPTGRLR